MEKHWKIAAVKFALLIIFVCNVLASPEDYLQDALFGDMSRLERILDSGVSSKAKYDALWTLIIYAAVDHGHDEEYVKRMELLINKGANVNTESGEALLMFAAGQCRKPIVELLILKGADVDAKSKDGTTALINAKERGHKDIISLLERVSNTTLVDSWNAVKLKRKEFMGKRIRIKSEYKGVADEEYISLSQGSIPHTFDSELVDTILSLKDFSSHMFVGTVMYNNLKKEPYMHIDTIITTFGETTK